MRCMNLPATARALAALLAAAGLVWALCAPAESACVAPALAEETATPPAVQESVPDAAESASVALAPAETSSTLASQAPPMLAVKDKPKPVDTRPWGPKFIPRKGKSIYIDRKHQRVYLYEDGRQIDKFLCSTSRTLPRRGKYHMTRKRRQSWSFNGAVTFYWQVIFTVGPAGHNIAFHSVPVNHAGQPIAPLGKPVSHGCVRVHYKKAKFIYFWINKRTPIYVRP